MKFLQRTRSYVFVCSGSSSVEPVSPNIVSRPSHYLSPLSLLSPAYCTVLPALWLIRGRSLLSLSLLQLPGCSTASSCCLRVFHIDDVSWAQEEKFLRHLSFRLYVKVIYNLSICVILKFSQSQVFFAYTVLAEQHTLMLFMLYHWHKCVLHNCQVQRKILFELI